MANWIQRFLAAITTHKADVSAHHTQYTDAAVLLVAAALIHAARHEDTGADEISVAGLAGLLADDQHVLDAEVLLVAAALVHAARHENAGADEISVAGLSGELADNQPPKAHKTSHQDGGGDEVSVTGLAGLLAADQHVLDAEVLLVAAALVHAARHEDTGADEISVAGLAGLLADDQHVLDAEVLLVAAALIHASRHENAGADEISVAGLAGLLAEDQHVIDAEVTAVAAAIIHAHAASDVTSEQFSLDRLPRGATNREFLMATGAGSSPVWAKWYELAPAQTVAHFQDNPAVGTIVNQQNINNGVDDDSAAADALNEYATITFDRARWIGQFRIRTYGVNCVGDGHFKLQYWDLGTEAWVDWKTGIPTQTVLEWQSWDSSPTTVCTDKVKIVCTAVDTRGGSADTSYINELEVKD